jgi:hypothetical protein
MTQNGEKKKQGIVKTGLGRPATGKADTFNSQPVRSRHGFKLSHATVWTVKVRKDGKRKQKKRDEKGYVYLDSFAQLLFPNFTILTVVSNRTESAFIL